MRERDRLERELHDLGVKALHSNFDILRHGSPMPVVLEAKPSREKESATPPSPSNSGGDPSLPTKAAEALRSHRFAEALRIAIEAGWRDTSRLTNLVFFARHPELPRTSLQPTHPNFDTLRREWSAMLRQHTWPAIEKHATSTSLHVSGQEVVAHHRFFLGAEGKRLKAMVENAAISADINPGILGTVMMAETRRPRSYLSSGKVSSYHIGTDDFYDDRAAIKRRVPAYSKVGWDRSQRPLLHLNDARKPRMIRTIFFDTGADAALATAVVLKFREVRLREQAATLGGNFESLAMPTRFALMRMSFAAGVRGVLPHLEDALAGKDIFVRAAIPVRKYQTRRNATVRTAQAIHLSDWVFGIPITPPP